MQTTDSNIAIYQTPDGETIIDVRLEGDTVWLSRMQIAQLLHTQPQNVSLHIGNIYREKELDEASTRKDFFLVQNEGNRKVSRLTKFYNLDVIISVGYRVKSQRGTQFRIWANKILKDYIIRGYAINHNAKAEQLDELKQTIAIMRNVLAHKSITQDEAVGLLRVISDYSYGLDTLDRYDYQTLDITQTTKREVFRATYKDAIEALAILKDKFGGSDLFAHEKDDSFKSTMGVIYQTFDGQELYPSIEEKAAHLLYLTVKNHSFSDGNKRIAAFLFCGF